MSVLSQNNLLLESFDLLTNTVVLGVLYGIVFSLYCLCAWLSYLQLQGPGKQRQAKFTLAYTSLIILCTTTMLALSARVCQLAYVNYGNFPGGPLEYESLQSSSTGVYRTASGVVDMIIEVLTMAIQVWRLWIVWSGVQYAVAVTTLSLLLLFAFIGLDIFVDVVPGFLSLKRMGVSYETFLRLDTAAFSILSTFTILVTGLVIGRLLLVRRRHMKLMGMQETSSPYMSVVAMLVESYALESIWSIGAAISFGMGSPSIFLFSACDSTIKVIAYFLVVIRVAAGRGWTKETGRKLTTLQWDRCEEPSDV